MKEPPAKRICISCGDTFIDTECRSKCIGEVVYPGRCNECLEELRDGKIRRWSVTFYGGGNYGPMQGETNPMRDNCIRILEEDK